MNRKQKRSTSKMRNAEAMALRVWQSLVPAIESSRRELERENDCGKQSKSIRRKPQTFS